MERGGAQSKGFSRSAAEDYGDPKHGTPSPCVPDSWLAQLIKPADHASQGAADYMQPCTFSERA